MAKKDKKEEKPTVWETPLWWDITFKGIRAQFNKFLFSRSHALHTFDVLHLRPSK